MTISPSVQCVLTAINNRGEIICEFHTFTNDYSSTLEMFQANLPEAVRIVADLAIPVQQNICKL